MNKECIQQQNRMIAGTSHTIACCLSMPRVWVEYDKSMPRACLQYGWGATLFSLGAPFVFLRYPCRGSEESFLYFPLSDNTYTPLYLGMIGYKQVPFINASTTLIGERIPISIHLGFKNHFSNIE